MSCSSCQEDSPGQQGKAEASVPALAPVPTPKGLIGELVVAQPGSTWTALRKLGGEASRWLPATFPMLAATSLGLPAAVAAQLREDSPMVGALADSASDRPDAVLGICVRSGREVVALLTTGNSPSHSVERDPKTGMALLVPSAEAATQPVALGVLGDYLLIAPHQAQLRRLGAFVGRTLPRGAKSPGPIGVVVRRAALQGPVARRLRALWRGYRSDLERADRENRQQRGGRAPDFGDPAAALVGMDSVVEGLLAAMQTSRKLVLSVEPAPGRLQVRLELEALPKGAAADLISQLSPGKLTPLLQLPRRTVLAIATRASRSSREASATSMSEGLIGLLGDRLGEQERVQLRETLTAFAQGRGAESSYGVLLGAAGPSVVMRGSLHDPAAFDRGARGLFRLLRLRAFEEPLAQFVGDLQVKQDSVRVEGLDGKVRRALVTVKPAPMRLTGAQSSQVDMTPSAIQFVWWLKAGEVYGASAREAAPALVEVATCAADPANTLRADPAVAAAVKRLGDQVSFAVLVQPLALGLGESEVDSAPLLAAIGRSGHRGWLRIDAHRAAVERLVHAVAKR